MIHVFVGTKAQFIKMAPLMREFDDRGIHYNFIDSGQHRTLTSEISREFGLRHPDVFLRRNKSNINSLRQALVWTISIISLVAFRKQKVRQDVFLNRRGICLIHGDTLTTLVSLIYAKRCGLKVAHIEAGLRSYRITNPFPEELIRLLAMRFSDILFAPSDWAYENLQRMGYANRTINIGGNTIVDSIKYAKSKFEHKTAPRKYSIATIHRTETIYSRSRLAEIVELLERISDSYKVLFVLHKPTSERLIHYGFYKRLKQNPNIKLLTLQPYLEFLYLLSESEFAVTDGGSIQEECYYLGVPCLIMRTRTERREGLGETAILSHFDRDKIERFIHQYKKYKHQVCDMAMSPSARIVDHISVFASNKTIGEESL